MEKSQKKPRHYRRRIISGFTTLLLLVAVVGCLYIVLQSMSTGYVQLGGHSLFRVMTGSMEPTISTGAILLAQETPIEDIKEEDIVCFRSRNPGSEGLIVTHRVVRVYDTPEGVRSLQTKGDASVVDATPVTDTNLIGRVIWYTGDENGMEQIIQFLSGDFGFVACIVLPVLLIAVWIFRDASRNLRKEIKNVEAQLDEQEEKRRTGQAATMTEQEYNALYEKVKNEVRKEMEQHEQGTAVDPQPVETAGEALPAAPSDETAPVAESGESTGDGDQPAEPETEPVS